MTDFKITVPHIVCPKHGKHTNMITSNIPGHEGHWCQICWLETLGDPLPTVDAPGKGSRSND